jgi:D-glycero-D-manno-heptose 1,7-bisphosphate phosphatase
MKLIILDRDGVINYDSKDYIKSPYEWQAIPGSLEAISLLNSANYTISVATNQSGIARGLFTKPQMHSIHKKLHREAKKKNAEIDSIFYCPHGPEDHCDCRKPKPGLLAKIATYYEISLEKVYFVGDSLRDIECALNFGAKPVLLLTGNGEASKDHKLIHKNNVPIFADLMQFSKHLLATEAKLGLNYK